MLQHIQKKITDEGEEATDSVVTIDIDESSSGIATSPQKILKFKAKITTHFICSISPWKSVPMLGCNWIKFCEF